MGSRNPRLNPYDPKTLDALEQAFDATWAEVQARDSFRDFERDSELKTALSEKLKMLAADGVTDPIELREWALESLMLNTPRSSGDGSHLTLRAALAADRLEDFVRQEEARGVELGSGSDFERALALFLVQRGLRQERASWATGTEHP